MLFQVKPSPGQIKKIEDNSTNLVSRRLPTTSWGEFASHMSINGRPFKPYDYQIALCDALDDHKAFIGVKSRQIGFSECIISYLIYRAVKVGEDYTALVFSRTGTDTRLLAHRCRKLIKSIGLSMATDSLTDLIIDGFGRIRFLSTTIDASRGAENVYDVFYDECFHLPELKDLRDAAAACQSIPSELGVAKEMFVGTPNYTNNYAYELLANGNGFDLLNTFDDIDAGLKSPAYLWTDQNGWLKAAVHFKAHPLFGRNPDEFMARLQFERKLDQDTIAREYRLSHKSAESSYFSPIDLGAGIVADIGDHPAHGQLYFIGIDPNAGSANGDNFSATVCHLDTNNGRITKVDGHYSKGQSQEYHLVFINQLIDKYRPVSVCIESNGTGKWVHEKLCAKFPFYAARMKLQNTDGETKRFLCSRVRYCLELKKLKFLKTDTFLTDAKNFRQSVKETTSGHHVILGAVSGAHDDDVMSMAMCLQSMINEGFNL